MTQWLLTHQPLLMAVTLLNGASLVALVIGISYRPNSTVTGVSP